MNKGKETGKEYTGFIILPSSNLKTLGEVIPLAQDKSNIWRASASPPLLGSFWEIRNAWNKSFGLFLSHRVLTEPHGELWGGAQESSQAEPDYRSAVRLQRKSFSCWTDCLLGIINHIGHDIYFPFKLLSNLAL